MRKFGEKLFLIKRMLLVVSRSQERERDLDFHLFQGGM
jgi:hypothetical protein